MTEHDPKDQLRDGLSTLTIAIIIVITVVALIFILSNFEQANINFLTLKVAMPKWLLFIVLVGGGIAIGWGTAALRYRKQKKEIRKSLD